MMLRTTVWLAQRQLRAKSPQTRLRAVQKLRASGSLLATDLLVEALGNDNPDVRREAAIALGEIKDQRSVQALIRAVSDPSESVQETAILSLKRLRDAGAVDTLVNALLRGGSNIQWHAAQALQSMAWEPKTVEEQIRSFVALGHYERAVPFGAAAVGPLTSALHGGTYERRVAVVNALGEIKDDAVLRPLQSALKDTDGLVRNAAAYALARLDNPQSVPALIAVLNDREKNVRVAVAVALGKLGDLRAVEPLIALLNDREWDVRAAGLESLGRLGDKRAFQPVAARLEDKDQEVRQYALDAVGQVGDDSVVEKLVLTMVDQHAGVRQAASRALNKLDPGWDRSERVQRLLPRIEAALKHSDSAVQYAATGLLRRITRRNAAESALTATRGEAEQRRQTLTLILQDLLRDTDMMVRAAAAESIGRLRLLTCLEALKTASGDSNSWVRSAVRQALQSLQ